MAILSIVTKTMKDMNSETLLQEVLVMFLCRVNDKPIIVAIDTPKIIKYSTYTPYGAIKTDELKGPIAVEITGPPKFPIPMNCVLIVTAGVPPLPN